MQTLERSSLKKCDLPSPPSRMASYDIDITFIAGERIHSVSETEKIFLPVGFRNQGIRLVNIIGYHTHVC